MQRHRHQEFVRFLNTIEAQVPVGKLIHAVVDNYATHKRLAKKPSTVLSQDAEVGVKWKVQRG
jgi:sulfopyruvate decarboxylase TPP-binding subunit